MGAGIVQARVNHQFVFKPVVASLSLNQEPQFQALVGTKVWGIFKVALPVALCTSTNSSVVTGLKGTLDKFSMVTGLKSKSDNWSVMTFVDVNTTWTLVQ